MAIAGSAPQRHARLARNWGNTVNLASNRSPPLSRLSQCTLRDVCLGSLTRTSGPERFDVLNSPLQLCVDKWFVGVTGGLRVWFGRCICWGFVFVIVRVLRALLRIGGFLVNTGRGVFVHFRPVGWLAEKSRDR